MIKYEEIWDLMENFEFKKSYIFKDIDFWIFWIFLDFSRIYFDFYRF